MFDALWVYSKINKGEGYINIVKNQKDNKGESHTFRNIISSIMGWTFGIAIGVLLVGITAFYIFDKNSSEDLIYFGITFMGLFLLFVYLGFVFHTIKEIDRNYFRNVMVGVSGGLAVWVFGGIKWDISKGFWLAINGVIAKVILSLAIIFIGFLVYRKLEKES